MCGQQLCVCGRQQTWIKKKQKNLQLLHTDHLVEDKNIMSFIVFFPWSTIYGSQPMPLRQCERKRSESLTGVYATESQELFQACLSTGPSELSGNPQMYVYFAVFLDSSSWCIDSFIKPNTCMADTPQALENSHRPVPHRHLQNMHHLDHHPLSGLCRCPWSSQQCLPRPVCIQGPGT